MSSRPSTPSFAHEVWNLPNIITIGRLFLIPPVLLLLHPSHFGRNAIAAGLFALATYLDLLDGQLARKHNLVTVFGKFVDPLADKIMATSVMIVLVSMRILPAWMVAVVVCRDLYINGLRQLAAERGLVIAAGSGGKAKTAIQLVSLCCVMLRVRVGFIDLYTLGMLGMWIGTVLAITSAVQYTQAFRRSLAQS